MRDKTRWILFLLLIIFGSGACLAQSINAGDIRGTVTDPSGAVIPGTRVTVQNVDTGVTKDFTTNRDGVFDTSSIVNGTYLLTFTKQGFEKEVRGPLSIPVGYTTINAQLKVGSATSEITVSTDVPLLHTETGDQVSTLEAHDMAEMPNVGGGTGPDWQNFMILLPGVNGTAGSSAGSSNPGQESSSNGNLPYENLLADGASTTLPSSQNGNPAAFEDVQELQVSLSSFSAQYGVGGMVINQITKGGTSKFHGSGYDYTENNALNAAGYQFASTTAKVPFLRYDDFGGTIGGPVAIPHLGLRKKAFFFFGYDQIINRGVLQGAQTVPTSDVLAGKFDAQDAKGDPIWQIYDPTTQVVKTDSHGNPYPFRQSFASEYGTNAIPSTMFDKVSANFQKFYPTGPNAEGRFQAGTVNAAGVDQNNWFNSNPNPNNWKRYFGRLDWDITPNNRLTMSDTQGDEIETAGQSGRVTDCPIGCQQGDVDNNNAQITDVWNISGKTINEARMGYTDQLNFFNDSSTGKDYPASLGWKFAEANILPAVQFQRNYPYAWIQPATNASYKEFIFDPSDVVTMIRGKHILHFGGEFTMYRDDTTSWGNINAGTLQFDGVYTENWTHAACGANPAYSDQMCADTNTGEEYADFLLGYPQNWSAGITPEAGWRLKKPQMFVQDDWKLHPNLTINLGLRYEISHGMNEVTKNMTSFDPTVMNTATNTLGAQWYSATQANGRSSMQANVFSTWLPRLGFAWTPKPNTTVRGGFGLYSYNWSQDMYGSGMGAALASSGSYNDQSNGIYPTTKFDGAGTLFPLGGGTAGPLPYVTVSQGLAALTSPTRFNGTNGSNYNAYHTPIPKIYQYNIGIERQLGANFAATVSYVGSHGFNLIFPTNINAVTSNRSSGDTSTCGTSGAVTATCEEPYPIFDAINGNLFQSISNYNALQATITKRMTQGLSFSFNYVWSHMLDDQDSSGWGSRMGPQPMQYASTLTVNQAAKNYGNSNFDVRQSFKGYVVYQLPFGKGKQFLNNNALADAVVGGWNFGATILESAGNPFQVYATSNTYQNAGSQYPNKVPGVSWKASGASGKCTMVNGSCTNAWVNPLAFSDPGAGNFGNAGRNPVVGPGLNVVNFSGGKTFTLPWEGIKLGMRCDASNLFNHASFNNPGQANGGINLSNENASGVYQTISPREINGTTEGGRNVQISARLSF
jgi:hypothetical protein